MTDSVRYIEELQDCTYTKMSKKNIRRILSDHREMHRRVLHDIHSIKSAMAEMLDFQPLQKIEALQALTSQHAQSLQIHESRLSAMQGDLDNTTNGQDMLSRAVRDNVAKLDQACAEVGRANNLSAVVNMIGKQMDGLTGREYKRDEELANLKLRLQAMSLEIDRLSVTKPTEPTNMEVVVKQAVNPVPRPPIDGDLSKGMLSVWKTQIINTADPSASLYWRRTDGGTLHLCELESKSTGVILPGEEHWAHPCCDMDNFPDRGPAKKEQPKAYCGQCLERCLRLLCERREDSEA